MISRPCLDSFERAGGCSSRHAVHHPAAVTSKVAFLVGEYVGTEREITAVSIGK